MARVVITRFERREALVAHEHQKSLLGKISRGPRVETGRPVLDRVATVGGERLSRRQFGARQAFGRQPFTG